MSESPSLVPEAARALERLLRRRRALSSVLLNIDMFDRWGPKEGEERDRNLAEGEAAQREHNEVTAALTKLATELQKTDAAAVAAWATAHLDLLDRFIAERLEDPSQDTARYVAKEEHAGWQEVREGKRPFVDENCFYVSVDRDRHRAWFGALDG